jgi:hypothetical protein
MEKKMEKKWRKKSCLAEKNGGEKLGAEKLCPRIVNRVARLDQFSPIGPLFSFGKFPKIIEVALSLWPLFSTRQVMY